LKDLPLPPHTLALYGSAAKIEAMKTDGAVRTADASHAMLAHGSWLMLMAHGVAFRWLLALLLVICDVAWF